MNELIDKLITTEYTCEDGSISPYSLITDKHISEALDELFEDNNLDINDWGVDGDTLFDSPSYSTGYVVASWIENGLLQTYHVVWEMR